MISLVAGGPGSFLVFYLGSLNIGQAWSAPVSACSFTIYGAAFWVYLSGLWGVSRSGREPLRLKKFYEDRMLGLRPLGQIVVSSAAIFSVAITITLGASLITGDVPSLASNLAIVAIGISMIFLPLTGIHRRMVGAKEEEEAKLSSLSKELFTVSENSRAPNQEDSPSTNVKDLIELEKFLELMAVASKISE